MLDETSQDKDFTVMSLPVQIDPSPQWIEHGPAGGATAQHGLVLDRWQVRPLLEGAKQSRNRNNHSGGLKSARGPHVPAEAHAIALLILGNVLRESSHGLVGGANTLLGRR